MKALNWHKVNAHAVGGAASRFLTPLAHTHTRIAVAGAGTRWSDIDYVGVYNDLDVDEIDALFSVQAKARPPRI